MTAKTVCGVFLVFFLGAVAGGLLSSIFFAHRTAAFLQRGSAAYVELLERRTTRGLGLDPGQRDQIHQLFMANLEERKRLQMQIQPQVQALNRETMRQISSVLRPDQEKGFRENLREFRRRFGRPGWNPGATNQPAAGIPSPATNSTVPATGGVTNSAPQN